MLCYLIVGWVAGWKGAQQIVAHHHHDDESQAAGRSDET
jgi:hypothetical protein